MSRRRPHDRETGAAVVEYALVVALVAGVVAGGVSSVGRVLDDVFVEVCAEIAGTSAPGRSEDAAAAERSRGRGGQARC